MTTLGNITDAMRERLSRGDQAAINTLLGIIDRSFAEEPLSLCDGCGQWSHRDHLENGICPDCYTQDVTCTHCRGEGSQTPGGRVTCFTCDGAGAVCVS